MCMSATKESYTTHSDKTCTFLLASALLQLDSHSHGFGNSAPLIFRSLSPSLRCFAAAETGGACAAARQTCLQCILASD